MSESSTTDIHDDLDPDIRRFQEQLNEGYAQFGDFSALPIDRRRQIATRLRAPWAMGGPSMVSSTDKRVGGQAVRVRILHPADKTDLPALVYIHGGGWTMFNLDTHDRLMREYAYRAGVVVIGVDYSLSPEARFPCAIDEIVSVFEWLRDSGDSEGIDSARIAIGGDSAGANLSVAVNLRLRDLGKSPCQAMLLNYGVYDNVLRPSYARYDGSRYMLTAGEMAMFWSNYLGRDVPRDHSLIYPLRADLTGLPPTFMTIAECDVLVDENLAMAECLKKAGVEVQAQVYRGTTHSFLEAVSIAAISDRAFAEASLWLTQVLSRNEEG